MEGQEDVETGDGHKRLGTGASVPRDALGAGAILLSSAAEARVQGGEGGVLGGQRD